MSLLDRPNAEAEGETEEMNEQERIRRFSREITRSIEDHRSIDDAAKESHERLTDFQKFDPRSEESFETEYSWDSPSERQVSLESEIMDLDDFVESIDDEVGELPSEGFEPDEVKSALQGRNLKELEEKYGLVKVKKGLETTLGATIQGKEDLSERMEVLAAGFGGSYDPEGRRASEALSKDTDAEELLKEKEVIQMVEENRSDLLDRIESYEHRITERVQRLDNVLTVYGQEMQEAYSEAMGDLVDQLEQLSEFSKIHQTAGEHDYQQLSDGNKVEQQYKQQAEVYMSENLENIEEILLEMNKMVEDYEGLVSTVEENAKHTREEFQPQSTEILNDMKDAYEQVKTHRVGNETMQYESLEDLIAGISDDAYDSIGNGINFLDYTLAESQEERSA